MRLRCCISAGVTRQRCAQAHDRLLPHARGIAQHGDPRPTLPRLVEISARLRRHAISERGRIQDERRDPLHGDLNVADGRGARQQSRWRRSCLYIESLTPSGYVVAHMSAHPPFRAPVDPGNGRRLPVPAVRQAIVAVGSGSHRLPAAHHRACGSKHYAYTYYVVS